MANHVTHTMSVAGAPERVTEFHASHILPVGATAMKPAHEDFDFNTLIPMPKCLDGIPASGAVYDAIEAVTGKTVYDLVAVRNPNNPEQHKLVAMYRESMRDSKLGLARQKMLSNLPVAELELGLKAAQAIEECGYPTWYEWAVANWGTKWGAYDYALVSVEPGRLVCRFDTAWSVPEPIFTEMARRYPDLTFVIDSFDEGWNFAEHGEGVAGVYVGQDVPTNAASYFAAYGEMPPVEAEPQELFPQNAQTGTIHACPTDDEDPLGRPIGPPLFSPKKEDR